MILVASECALGDKPKNSLEGFRECIDLGVGAIEFDVHLAPDGSIRVHHDYDIADQLTRPTLDEFIEYHQSQNSTSELWIELKTSPFQRSISSDPDQLLAVVLDAVHSAGLEALTLLLAFEWNVLLAAQQHRPAIRTNYLSLNEASVKWLHRDLGSIDPTVLYGPFNPADHDNSIPRAIAAAGGAWWGPYGADLTAEHAEQSHQLGLLVGPWGATSADLKRFSTEGTTIDVGPFRAPTA